METISRKNMSMAISLIAVLLLGIGNRLGIDLPEKEIAYLVGSLMSWVIARRLRDRNQEWNKLKAIAKWSSPDFITTMTGCALLILNKAFNLGLPPEAIAGVSAAVSATIIGVQK